MGNESKKKKYRIWFYADGFGEGIVSLTDEEFEVVNRVLDINNWENVRIDSCYGCPDWEIREVKQTD